MELKFKAEQIALAPHNPERAKEFMKAIGALEWFEDTVVANGVVFGEEGQNEGRLRYNYQTLEAKELEILNYPKGNNWIEAGNRVGSVSHFGMHCSEEELEAWKVKMAELGVKIAQEVHTQSHTNPHIAGKRQYHYCIFDTREIIGTDLKFIVRINLD